MAMVSVTYADALIACFDAKYHYAFWRPITAIRAGDTDGNEATVGDPTWSTLLAGTPNHPEYPSAHSCVTPAGGLVVARFLGTPEIDFTVPSLTGFGDRHFAACPGSGVRGLERPHLGRHPLPLSGRGRRRDRQEDRPPRARAPLQAVERLDRRHNTKEEGRTWAFLLVSSGSGRVTPHSTATGWRGGDLRLFAGVRVHAGARNRRRSDCNFASTLQASGFRSDVSVFRLNALSRRKTGSEPAFRRNTAERVHTIEAAHNPEVAGSNPAPATHKGPVNGVSCCECNACSVHLQALHS